MIDLSFLQFSRMTPRERMLRGIQGQLSPTFGLEVGAPRAQLGVIPLRGLGLWRPSEDATAEFNPGQTSLPSSGSIVAPESGIVSAGGEQTVNVYSAPAPTLVPMSTATVTTDPITSAPSYTELNRTAGGPSSYADAPVEQQVSDDGDYAPSENPPMVEGGSQSDSRDDYDPSSYASGTDDDTQVDQYTDYDSDGNKQDAWGEGGGSWGSNAQDHDTMANKGAIKKVATKTEAAIQQVKTTAVQYWPWILGGGVLLGAAFLMGRRK